MLGHQRSKTLGYGVNRTEMLSIVLIEFAHQANGQALAPLAVLVEINHAPGTRAYVRASVIEPFDMVQAPDGPAKLMLLPYARFQALSVTLAAVAPAGITKTTEKRPLLDANGVTNASPLLPPSQLGAALEFPVTVKKAVL